MNCNLNARNRMLKRSYYLVHYLMDGNGHKKAGTVDDGTRQAHMKKTRK